MSEEKLLKFFDVLLEELQCCQPASEPIRFARDRQIERAMKRARLNTPGLDDKAVRDFLATNDLVGNRRVTLDTDLLTNAKHFILTMLERFTTYSVEDSIQMSLDYSLLFDFWKFGPGASYGIRGTHTVDKIKQRMTCTALSKPLVVSLRRRNPYFTRFDYENEDDGTSLVRGSRLATVPKNQDTMRTIAIEPSGSMALQLAAGSYLEGVLRYIGLDIQRQQPRNKELARRGSISNSLATIDLKSASDMISPELVRLLFPKVWYDLLMRIRSPEIELPDGSWVHLNMISTMGNGFTFPLMTLIISSLVYGLNCRDTMSPNLFLDWTNVGVYGDDIIIPVRQYESMLVVLQQAGLIVNIDKSYGDGPFRESCGGDYYLGWDVTPFYVKDLSTPSQTYVVINQVLEWGTRNNIFLYRTLLYLKDLLGGKVFLVPEWMNPDQGILTSQCSRHYKYLQSVPRRVPNESSVFDMMLAVGGYLVSSASGSYYTPRSFQTKVRTRKGRFPKGYLSAWDPRKRTQVDSNEISTIVEILF